MDFQHITRQQLRPRRRADRALDQLLNHTQDRVGSYLTWSTVKNQVNRATDWHYLMLPVAESTAPINGIDYIHPAVKPAVDYATAVIIKGLAPQGRIDFEFRGQDTQDRVRARQATDMVDQLVNQRQDPHHMLGQWVMDAVMHKNGCVLVLPAIESQRRIVEVEGNQQELQAFEAAVAASGQTATRISRRLLTTPLDQVQAQFQQWQSQQAQLDQDLDLENRIQALESWQPDDDTDEPLPGPDLDAASQALADIARSLRRWTARYRVTGDDFRMHYRNIPQHTWFCDPRVVRIQDQPFCGFYDTVSISQAAELYPGLDMEEFRRLAQPMPANIGSSSSEISDSAIHARDTQPQSAGFSTNTAQGSDDWDTWVSIITVWVRVDWDDDGQQELIELVYSGDYIISAREVEFIPVANMCPRPLPNNFYGMSIGESVVPQQEYATAAMRAEILLGLLTATPRLGVKADRLDFESLQNGDASIFLLDSRFDPSTDVYPVPPPGGNLAFMENALTRLQQDSMSMVGMTTPQDTFNPEIMHPGNSGIKLQLALTPNQIIQDNTVRAAAQGVRELLWLTWRTLVANSDNSGVRQLAQASHPDRRPEMLDAMDTGEATLQDRTQMDLELGLGMLSEENAVMRSQAIGAAQQQLYQLVQGMAAQGTLTPEIYVKVRRPTEDLLGRLGVRDPNLYLPSDQEVMAMIQGAAQQAQNRQPSPQEQREMSVAELNRARAAEIQSNMSGSSPEAQLDLARSAEIQSRISGTDADSQLNYMSLALGRGQDYRN